MTVNIYAPTESDGLSLVELELYHLLMAYRAEAGLPAIPLSSALTATAGRHVLDTAYNIWEARISLPVGANLHSWSDAPYYADHRDPGVMWNAPVRLGLNYPGAGYEISAAGFMSIAEALVGWQGSPGHDGVIMNRAPWDAATWNAIGVGVVDADVETYGGRAYHVWFGQQADPAGGPVISGSAAAETLRGTDFTDRLHALDGGDTIHAGAGDDIVFAGETAADLRDLIFAGAGNDWVDAGYGNDEVYGHTGNDTLIGGFGADTLAGQSGDDLLSGGALADMLFGGPGDDLLNGGFGHDRMNGGSGADRFYHLGIADHGSDWVQDFSAAEGDRLVFGGAARADQFQINRAATPGAGAADTAEAFVIYRPTGQILWALVDGTAQPTIELQIGDRVFDLLA
jgi:hypothetical protein